jgi:hypothetical protein
MKNILHPALAEALNITQQNRKQYFDKSNKIVKFEENQWVKLTNLKMIKNLENKYNGPYCINTIHKNKSFTLHDINGHVLPGTYAPSHITLISEPNFQTNEYEVDCIIDHRINKGKLEYRIHWAGYKPKEDTWEPEKLIKSKHIIKAYNELKNRN